MPSGHSADNSRAGEANKAISTWTNAPMIASGLFPDRYALIDAWRGLAALAVCIHHSGGILIGRHAVLVFFVISGYCIAAAADQCRRNGYGFGTFMWRRARRIYPPYLLSLAFWAATRLLKWHQTGDNDLARPVIHWIQNLTLTQWLTLLFEPRPYAPVNPSLFVSVYWSLCYEEQFYIVCGLFLLAAAKLRWDPLHSTLALLGCSLAWNVAFPQTSCWRSIDCVESSRRGIGCGSIWGCGRC
jgi:peptidoglycan/LPS O-acetylase OafA/YrhL